jgi:hypothetical protein
MLRNRWMVLAATVTALGISGYAFLGAVMNGSFTQTPGDRWWLAGRIWVAVWLVSLAAAIVLPATWILKGRGKVDQSGTH